MAWLSLQLDNAGLIDIGSQNSARGISRAEVAGKFPYEVAMQRPFSASSILASISFRNGFHRIV